MMQQGNRQRGQAPSSHLGRTTDHHLIIIGIVCDVTRSILITTVACFEGGNYCLDNRLMSGVWSFPPPRFCHVNWRRVQLDAQRHHPPPLHD